MLKRSTQSPALLVGIRRSIRTSILPVSGLKIVQLVVGTKIEVRLKRKYNNMGTTWLARVYKFVSEEGNIFLNELKVCSDDPLKVINFLFPNTQDTEIRSEYVSDVVGVYKVFITKKEKMFEYTVGMVRL